ncbi:MAG: ABC transporter ATP-binding protein [Bacilli bacterium]
MNYTYVVYGRVQRMEGTGDMDPVTMRDVTKLYGRKRGASVVSALQGVSLTVDAGEFVSIMGPSGSGKTTLLNLLAGLDQPTSGTVEVASQRLDALSPDALARLRRSRVGFVFQDFNLLDTLTLAENVWLPLALEGHKGPEAAERVSQVMTALGVDSLSSRYPYEVSGGQQQRAAVARALASRPALLLADEPTGNLDSGAAQDLLALLSTLHQEDHATIVMVTHDPFAASYSQRVILLRDGQVYGALHRSGERRMFFQEILDMLAVVESGNHP